MAASLILGNTSGSFSLAKRCPLCTASVFDIFRRLSSESVGADRGQASSEWRVEILFGVLMGELRGGGGGRIGEVVRRSAGGEGGGAGEKGKGKGRGGEGMGRGGGEKWEMRKVGK